MHNVAKAARQGWVSEPDATPQDGTDSSFGRPTRAKKRVSVLLRTLTCQQVLVFVDF